MAAIRLHVLLARAGFGSRRACEALIAEGRVRVNGQPVTQPGTRVDPASDHVRVGNRRVGARQPQRWFALHKPRGVVSAASDPEGRTTVVDLLAGVRERVYPVGRLDVQSDGLVLLTNDGDLAAALLHPRRGVPRTYLAKVRGQPDDKALARLERGVVLEGRRTGPVKARITRSTGNASWLEVVVHEGRKHLVRDALAAVGHQVVKLRRIAFGPIRLGRLRPGAFRPLEDEEVAALRRVATAPARPRETPARATARPRRPLSARR